MEKKVNILRQTVNKGNMGNREYKKIPFWIEGTGNDLIKFRGIKEQLHDTDK